MKVQEVRSFRIDFTYNGCKGAYASFIINGWNRSACECFVRDVVYNDNSYFCDTHCTVRAWDSTNGCYIDEK